MRTKIEHLRSRLTICKKMLEEVQEDLNIDYQVESSLQEIIDLCGDTIVRYCIEPLHSTPISGDQPIPDPLAEAKIDIYNQHFNRKVNF